MGPAGWPERVLLGVGSVFILVVELLPMLVGGGLIVLAVLIHLATRRWRARRDESGSEAGTTAQAPADAQ